MKANLVQREPETLRRWEEMDVYGQIQKERKAAPPFILHDGPPFANGDVHMGTALNKILKDMVVKSKTMAGFHTPFLPGWDCHGLPIEFKVVKQTRGLSPVEVRKKSEALARQFIDVQRAQFKRLGVFGDWEHPYLTLDASYEAEVIRAFVRFVEEDLVYQSKKPVYWSTGAQTALAEAEVEYEERDDPAIYVRFQLVDGPLANKADVVIWTTTPWTLPANLAIAVNPTFRYSARNYRHPEMGVTGTFLLADGLVENFCKETGFVPTEDAALGSWLGSELEGWKTQHPFLNRVSPIILGEHVTLEAGTGNVHTAPGHGNDDFVVGRKYGLPVLSPVDERGFYLEECGVPELVGKYVFDANKDVLEILKRKGALVFQSVLRHTYPHCWRSKTPIVFRAVEQFFIRMDKLRPETLKAIDTIQWIPHWGRNRIYGTVESRPDWCISRQRSWGVPVPVFYDANGNPVLRADWIYKIADLVEQKGTNCWFDPEDTTIAKAVELPEGFTRRNDTLDVWIDSGISHEAVVRKMMHVDGPSDLYLEATDQHRGWFQSSLVTSVALRHAAPYKTCLTHGFVVDVESRKKISKSAQGTGAYAKPTEADHFVNKYGADIVRLWVSSVNFTDEVPFGEEMFARLTETYRRMRNTLRILLGNLNDFELERDAVTADQFTTVDRWILHRLQEVIAVCNEAYANLEFHKVYHAINQFCAVDLSSLYIDITKDRMYCDAPNSNRRRSTQTAMHILFSALCRLLAPICVFTAEEAWGFFKKDAATRSIHLEKLPTADASFMNPKLAEQVEEWLKLRAIISQEVEKARQQKQIGNALEAKITLHITSDALYERLAGKESELEEFFVLSEVRIVRDKPTQDAAEANATASLETIAYAKCERCWRYRPEVGKSAAHPTLCERCESVIEKLP